LATKKTGTREPRVRVKATMTTRASAQKAASTRPKAPARPKAAAGATKAPKASSPKAPATGLKALAAAKPPRVAKASPRPSTDSAGLRAARDRAVMAAAAGLEKKAQGVEIIDVSGKVDYADFLVLMTGGSDRHVASIVQSVEEAAKRSKQRPLAVEGMPAAEWVLVDLADVVVHVFQESARSLYDIDGLWMDASRVPIPGRVRDLSFRLRRAALACGRHGRLRRANFACGGATSAAFGRFDFACGGRDALA
jgi:ribosome-associated protein